MKINGTPIERIPISITHPEPLVHYSVKVKQETKDRFQAQVKKGRTQEELMRIAVEVCEYIDAQAKAELSNKKKEFKNLMTKVK